MTYLAVVAGLAVLVIAALAFRYRAPNLSHFDSPEPETVIPASDVSAAHQDVLAILEQYHAQPRVLDPSVGRRRFEEMFARNVDVKTIGVVIDGLSAEWVLAEGADHDRRLLYIHGGAFTVGSPKTHRHITAEISRRTALSVLSIDYRMIPENRILDCHEDARRAYQWILNNGPAGPSASQALFVAGDSAGGNLTLAVIAWARNQGWQHANGAIALSPLTDSTLSGPSWKTNQTTDPFLGPGLGRLLVIPSFIRNILGRINSGIAGNDVQLSPLFGPLHNLPPTLIQVSRDEMLYSDALRYANRAKHEGSQVTLQAWPTMVHVFQGFDLPETDHAFSLMAEFVAERS